MIDLHVHVLPGVDDGPPDLEGALALARAALDAGTTTLVATPHVDHSWGVDPLGVPAAVASLSDELTRHGISIEVRQGAEIAIPRIGELGPEELDAVRLGGGPYLLVESPLTPISGFERVLFELAVRGERVLLAHTERCPAFQRDPDVLAGLVAGGMLSSITGASLTGDFGSTARRTALHLLREGLVHDVASDAHDTRRRPPPLLDGLRAAEREVPGVMRRAGWLTLDAPAAILAGEAPPAPPPLDPPVRRWWRRGGS